MQAIILAAGMGKRLKTLTGGTDAAALTKALLVKHNILIKDLKAKTGGRNYIRLAVRNTEDNDRLIAALREEIRA